MNAPVIVNGRILNRDETRAALAPFSAAGYPIWPTADHHDAADLARRAVDSGTERLIVAGGDGTISRVINGLAPDFAALELAVVPLGTGNDLARALGIPMDDPATAVRIAQSDRVVEMDLIRVSNGETLFFANAASGGVGGKVASDVQSRDKQRWGAFAYWMTAVSYLVDLQEYEVLLQMDDGVERQMKLYGLSIANGRFVGGGFPIAPVACLNDGLLDVTALPVMNTMDLLAAGMNFTLGRSDQEDRVDTFQARRIHLRSTPDIPFSVDGEPIRTLEATFEVVPSALRVCFGPVSPAVRCDQEWVKDKSVA